MQGIWKFKSKLASNTLISLILYSVSIYTTSVQLTVVDEVYFRGIFFSNGHILTTEGSSDHPCIWNPKIWSEVERKKVFCIISSDFYLLPCQMNVWFSEFVDGARNAQVTVSPTTIDLYLTVIQKSYTGKIFSSVACSQCPCYFLCSVYLHRSRILQFR